MVIKKNIKKQDFIKIKKINYFWIFHKKSTKIICALIGFFFFKQYKYFRKQPPFFNYKDLIIP